MTIDRRKFLARSTALAALATGTSAIPAQAKEQPETKAKKHANRIIVSTYSFWQFKNEKYRDIELCIDLAAEMGFDGFEILHRQMQNEDNDYLQRLKKKAFVNGLHLCGFSTHQGFLFPDEAERQKNVDHTIK
jgi:hypothetical protein